MIMKTRYFKLVTVCLLAVSLFASCLGDLDTLPLDDNELTGEMVYSTPEGYIGMIAKCYAALIQTGQKGGDGGDGDVSGIDEGYSGYTRALFYLQEACTDEIVFQSGGSKGVRAMLYLNWDASTEIVGYPYYRLFMTINYCNEFLRECTESKLQERGVYEALKDEYQYYCAEARFIRALAYTHALDLFRNVPFVTEEDPVGNYLPPRYTGKQLFDYLESELKAIDNDLLDRTACEYGRASRSAAHALLARLYLNAEVYTGTARWTDCITYCNRILTAGYTLEDNYALLFNADNHLRTNEIIYAFPVDSERTMTWGATTYIICGSINNTSDTQLPTDYGVPSGWGSFRLRGEFPNLFDANDGRAMFYTEGQTQSVDVVESQSNGYLSEKWTNLTDAGEAGSPSNDGSASTDFPVFRLADVYLMLAEAVVRGGEGSSRSTALGYVNELRMRAFGNDSGNISDGQMTVDFILDERARELYMECVRRTDLIRYGKFTTAVYLWQWKGGTITGQAVDDKFNIYPIPSTELTANPNLYNENY